MMEQGTYFIDELIAMCYVVSLTLMVWKLFGIVLQAETKSTNSYTYIYQRKFSSETSDIRTTSQ